VAIEENRSVLDVRNLLRAKANLAADEYSLHQYAEAEKLQRDTYAGLAKELGPTHLDTLLALGNLANTLSAEKKYAEAEAMQLKLVDSSRKADLPKSYIGIGLYNLSCTLALEGQADRAMSFLTQAAGDGQLLAEVDIAHDTDLNSLRARPDFQALVAKVMATRASKRTAAPAAPAAPRTPPASRTPPPARR
jgi:hypothetical protein